VGSSEFAGPRERLISLLPYPRHRTTKEILMSSSPNTAINSTSARVSRESAAITAKNITEVAGRGFLAVLFLLSGLGKIGAYTTTAAYMSSVGVPSILLPVVIVTEVLGALAIVLGWQTRITALLLAGYSLLTALVFHTNFADQIEMVMFLKNVSIAGGFLLLVVHGAGPLSLDRRLAK
jgi:putative oxidoreductase